MKTLLIDADILMFRFAFRHQQEIQWTNNVVSEVLDERRAKDDLDIFIDELMAKTGCGAYTLCFTHAVNFRYAELPTYKANRANLKPPTMLKILKNHMLENHHWRSWEYLEADDLMGILGTKHPKKYILTSNDKDFKSIPVTLYNWNKPKTSPRRISEREADFWFHYQWLRGDPGDNYGGCKGIGDKKARVILKGVHSQNLSAVVIQAYASQCYSWKEILQQARMARILRVEDYDFRKRKVKLWTPNC